MGHRYIATFLASGAAWLAFGVGVAQADQPVVCAARQDLAGPCEQVHGRLNAWNGGPAIEKIWVIGTKRLLAVYSRTDYKMTMPKAIIDQLHSFDTKIYADFSVCPLVKQEPRHESYVCVESAKNILVERHETVNGQDQVKYTKVPDTGNSELVAE